MLTVVCALKETKDLWPTIFFGSGDKDLFEDFLTFTNTPNQAWNDIYKEVRSCIEKTLGKSAAMAVDKCHTLEYFWWRAFTDHFSGIVTGQSDNESLLTRQELIDMCNFNIAPNHKFASEFAAKTYEWLCANRSKFTSINLQFV